ncbi:MAG: nucleotidyltransferase domain-containing protein, partial [Gemmatimonadaceae bacterium]
APRLSRRAPASEQAKQDIPLGIGPLLSRIAHIAYRHPMAPSPWAWHCIQREHSLSHSLSQEPAPVPDAVARIAGAMRGFAPPWALCGGWAVDAWLRGITREHGDVDLSVFVQDQRALHEHLRGWQLLAHEPGWAPGTHDQWWDGEHRLSASTHIHARPPERTGPMPKYGIATDEDGFYVEFYLDDRVGDDWVLSRDAPIRVALRDAVRQSQWGVPAVSPEVLLFFKARDLRRQDKLDFAALLPRLTDAQRGWLGEAIALVGHPWLANLSAG